MDERLFEAPEWFRALTLEERAASLAQGSGGDPGPPLDPEDAEYRDSLWRSQAPFSQDGFFARRLAADGLSEASFHFLLGEPADELARRAGGVPGWLASLKESFSTIASDPFPTPTLREGARAHLAFFEVVRPLLDAAASRLRREIRKLAAGRDGLLFDPATAADLFAGSLSSRLILLLGRAMVLELSLAGREGRLSGETPEARFQSFAASLRDRETALGILRQYPVLARQALEAVDRWVDVSLDFLRHLRDDATALRAAFFPDFDPGLLVRIEGGLGDSHRGGQSVIIAELASGLRLVYKPKPMGVELAFQNLLAWVGGKGFAPAFRLLRVVSRGDHGWVEMVEAKPCSSREELERFYRRQGGYLALLYLLSATDFHHENLIAAGEHPVLVDLEALFHPWAEDLGRTPEEGLIVGRPVFETVLRTGMLPLRSREGEGGHGGLDLSGLAAAAGQMTPQPTLMNEKGGTDAMRYVRRPVEIPVGQHRPTLDGADVSLGQFLGPLLDGFTSMGRLLAAHQDELAAPGGVLDAFAGTEVRVILRPTRTYATLLVEAQHPFVLGDSLERDRLFDRLWEAVEERPCLAGLVTAERRDLLKGDVPLCHYAPGIAGPVVRRRRAVSRVPAILRAGGGPGAPGPIRRGRAGASGLDHPRLDRGADSQGARPPAVSARRDDGEPIAGRGPGSCPGSGPPAGGDGVARPGRGALALRPEPRAGNALGAGRDRARSPPGIAGDRALSGLSGRRHRRGAVDRSRPRRSREPALADRTATEAPAVHRRLFGLGRANVCADPSRGSVEPAGAPRRRGSCRVVPSGAHRQRRGPRHRGGSGGMHPLPAAALGAEAFRGDFGGGGPLRRAATGPGGAGRAGDRLGVADRRAAPAGRPFPWHRRHCVGSAAACRGHGR